MPKPYVNSRDEIMRELYDTHAVEAYLADNLLSTKVARDEALAEVEWLTGPEARERLARRIYLDAHPGDIYAQRHWDFGGDQHVNREPWLARADLYLAVIAGTKE